MIKGNELRWAPILINQHVPFHISYCLEFKDYQMILFSGSFNELYIFKYTTVRYNLERISEPIKQEYQILFHLYSCYSNFK